MATLTFTHPNRPAQLHDELVAAVPALAPVPDPDGRTRDDGVPIRRAVLALGTEGDAITLDVPDTLTADELAHIAAVVAAHVPAPTAAQERAAAAGDLTAQYAAAVARLDAIIATGGTFTAAQVRDAVVDLARILRRTLRLLKAEVG